MLDDALRRLRLDRRMRDRQGWVSEAAFQKALDELPDVSSKVAPLEEAASGDGETEPGTAEG